MGLFALRPFCAQLGLVSLLWWGLNYRVEDGSLTELYWLLAGNLLYLCGRNRAGVFALRDNRAFCKIRMSHSGAAKIDQPFFPLKSDGQAKLCNDCGACNKLCPMDIPVSQFVCSRQRVLSTNDHSVLNASMCAAQEGDVQVWL